MTSPINPYPNLNLNLSRALKYNAEQNKTTSDTGTQPEPSTPPKSDVMVRLSQTNQQLQQLPQRLASQPEINQNRVSQLRVQIEAGSYKISPERIAERILAMEQQLDP